MILIPAIIQKMTVVEVAMPELGFREGDFIFFS